MPGYQQERDWREEQLDWLHQQHEELAQQTKLMRRQTFAAERTQSYVGWLLLIAVLGAVGSLLAFLVTVLGG